MDAHFVSVPLQAVKHTVAMEGAEASTSSHGASGKRKLWVACNACRFRKVKCDREPRLEQGYSACTNCESSSMECVLTVKPPKRRIGKRMKMLQEQNGSTSADANEAPARPATAGPATEAENASAPDAINGSSNGAALSISSSFAFDPNAAMSPGLSNLLQAVSQETRDHVPISSPSPSHGPERISNDTVAPSHSLQDVPIIQNGMFAALSSTGGDIFGTATDTLAEDSRRPSKDSNSGTIRSLHSSSPSAPGVTPKSAQAASDQSSPEVISSNAAFLSSSLIDIPYSRRNTLKQRNPFEKSPAEGSGQIGFAGGLLGIVSLDKHMLDACTKAYFDSMGQCIGFIRPEWFWPRYQAFFHRYAGFSLDIGPDAQEQPLSELLLIAVACRGAGNTNFANRFELQNDLYEHYRRLIKDRERLVRDGFDALESVILMVEHADGKARPLVDPMSVQGVFDVDPITHEGLIRLMKKLELNLEKPFGTRLEGRDMIRHKILFWTIYVYDAIRCEASRTLPLISQDEISVNRSLPAVGDQARLKFRDYFVELAGICRKISFKVTSNRAVEYGIDPQDVLDILDELQVWHDSIIPLFAWDWNDMLHITGPTDPEDQTRRTFMIFLFLGQWLTLDYAIAEIGISKSASPELKDRMLRRMKSEVDMTLDRQVLVCDHGTMFGLIRLHPGMMQSWTITWAGWAIKKMESIITEEVSGRLASAKAEQAFHRYQSAVICFVNAIATCDSAQHTPITVQELMTALRKVTDARKATRLTFDQL